MTRAVVDTTVLVSAVIRPQGALGFVIKRPRDGAYTYVYSLPLIEELVNVITRPKIYVKYGLTAEDVETLLLLLQWRGELVHPVQKVTLCRDPKDNKILETALSGKADLIVTSDADLRQEVAWRTGGDSRSPSSSISDEALGSVMRHIPIRRHVFSLRGKASTWHSHTMMTRPRTI